MLRPLVILLALIASASGKTIEYKNLAFFPDRWEKAGQSTEMLVWPGEKITFLTVEEMSGDLDPKVMETFIDTLDKGWVTFAELTGQTPASRGLIDGRSPIAAVPEFKLTCGYGCGMVGATGIEAGNFYGGDYPGMVKDATAVPHYYFYEMGRNYFTFGNRHNAFTTGFAVFMRYVCIDRLGLNDNDSKTRETIEKAESKLSETGLSFREAFSSYAGLSEKQNRVPGLSPSDQPVVYASAMLYLRKHLGDEWIGKFFRNIAACPGADPKTEEGFATQTWNWVLSASFAAGKNLTPAFENRWGLKVSDDQKATLKDIRWDTGKPDFTKLVSSLTQS